MNSASQFTALSQPFAGARALRLWGEAASPLDLEEVGDS